MLYATLRDERTLAALDASGARVGDEFDREVGGFAIDPASGDPVRIRGRLAYFGPPSDAFESAEPVAVVEFGRGNFR